MNERVMQFRIGMFVIVAGLVLTMLIVWFGESPSLLREHVYVTVHFNEAPGVAEGIPVRKSGIRVGEVSAIEFDERPDQPDGILVTLMLDPKYHFRAGSIPRLSRSLMGDAAIDILPGDSDQLMKTSKSPTHAPLIEGTVSTDPAKALAAATAAFEKVGGTLKAIDEAANGIAQFTKDTKGINEFVSTWTTTGQRVRAAADGIDRFIKANEKDVPVAVANVKEVTQKLNATLDPATQDALRTGLKQFSTAASQLTAGLNNAGPLFADLGAPVSSTPQTDFGQAVRRLNLIAKDLGLLTQALRDPSGKLNSNGSLQKLVTRPELYENINHFALAGSNTFEGVKPIIAAFRVFAEKISRDPSAIARGALQR